jgi:hypothetical protein
LLSSLGLVLLAYVGYSAVPNDWTILIVAIFVLMISSACGYITKDALVSFRTAAISCSTLLILSATLIAKFTTVTMQLPSQTGNIPVPTGGVSFVLLIALFFAPFLAGIAATSVAEFALAKGGGSLSNRFRVAGRPAIKLMDEHPWLPTVIAIVVGIATFILGFYLGRR